MKLWLSGQQELILGDIVIEFYELWELERLKVLAPALEEECSQSASEDISRSHMGCEVALARGMKT